MTVSIHSLAPQHLPSYIGTPDGGDPLFTAVLVLLVITLMVVGNLYFKLHAIPERMAHKHKHNNTQLQLITILAMLALFTHINIFWVAALLLAVVRLPDFTTPMNSIAKSLERLAEREPEPKSDENATPAAPIEKES